MFVRKILQPYFINKGYHLLAPLIKTSRGGIVKWPQLKAQIETHLKTDRNSMVTMLIDYYGIYAKHEYPGWDTAHGVVNKTERMHQLESAMREDIDPQLQYRFFPYLQLHEFEGLLFNDIEVIKNEVPPGDIVGMAELEQTFIDFPNPEMINDNKDTSPSGRLKRIIRGYNKVVYGNILAEAIGLERIRAKSPRFNNWVTLLENS